MPVVFITATGAGTWETPDGTTSIDSVECIGGGASGRTSANGGGGGGGGAYSKRTSISFTENQVFDLSVGAAAGSSSNGNDTWFGATTLASSLVGAKGGLTATSSTGGAGGAAASGFPTSGGTRNSGGAGGNGNATVLTGGGGGGAGGPGGNGGAGGAGDATSTGADCGGGGGSGAGTSTAGGTGSAGTASSGAGGTNANGGGSGGAGNSGAGTNATAATGMWTSTAGPGAATGGGGGGGGSAAGKGGDGANYGGGGGGRGTTTSTAATGAQGIIIITYTASAPSFTGPTYVSAGTHLEGSSVNMSYHSGVQAGRVAVLMIGSSTAPANTPSGWSVLTQSSADVSLKVCIKALTGSESGSFTIDSTFSDVSARMFYFDGVDTASLTESVGDATGPSGTTTPDSIVTTVAMALGVTMMVHVGTQGAPLSTNWTERAESVGGGGGSYVLSLDTRDMPSAGTKTGSARTAGTTWSTVTFALKPLSQLPAPRAMMHYQKLRNAA